jgi:hypothetical protein
MRVDRIKKKSYSHTLSHSNIIDAMIKKNMIRMNIYFF